VIETPDEFFAAAQAEYPDAPVWSGELYLELHRGTYTSQARTKAGNRRSEHLLREAELWARPRRSAPASTTRTSELDRLWKTVLLHQFHDILPGSSIAWVHREAEATYAGWPAELDEIIDEATARWPATGDTPWVFNASPLPRPRWWTVRGSCGSGRAIVLGRPLVGGRRDPPPDPVPSPSRAASTTAWSASSSTTTG
jgi:alpha-mannosidase